MSEIGPIANKEPDINDINNSFLNNNNSNQQDNNNNSFYRNMYNSKSSRNVKNINNSNFYRRESWNNEMNDIINVTKDNNLITSYRNDYFYEIKNKNNNFINNNNNNNFNNNFNNINKNNNIFNNSVNNKNIISNIFNKSISNVDLNKISIDAYNNNNNNNFYVKNKEYGHNNRYNINNNFSNNINNNIINNINNSINNNKNLNSAFNFNFNNFNKFNNNSQNLIKSNEFKFLFQKRYSIIISLILNKDSIIIQSKEEGNLYYFFETQMTLDELKKFDEVFKSCDNIENAFDYLLNIFKTTENPIKDIIDNKLILLIKIRVCENTFREKDMELFIKYKNKEESIKNLCIQIEELKKKNIFLQDEINKLKSENNFLKKNFLDFKNEIIKEINNLKKIIEKNKVKDISKDSKIIRNINDINFIFKRLKMVKLNNNNKENININLNLLYRATKDGGMAKDFHSRCDKYNNTLVLVETKKGLRFGGFTTKTWEGEEIDKEDKNAFCFSLDKMKIYNSIKGKPAIFSSPSSGPTFENCIFEIKDNCFEYGGMCSEDNGDNYDNQESKYEINNGEEEFEVKDVEVLEVIYE